MSGVALDARLEASEWHDEGPRRWLAAHLRAWERHRVKFGVLPLPGSCAEVFRVGGIQLGPDGPLPAVMRRDVQQVPRGGSLTVLLSDDALIYRFPYSHPDRTRRGELNPGFLDPAPLQERMCAALAALDGVLETVVLRMQPVYRTEELRAPDFVSRLDRFLGGLPRAYRYAVDLRTPAFNVPEYRACLYDHGAAHVLRHAPHLPGPSTDAPSLLDQLLVPGIISAPFCVAHVSARPRPHDDHGNDMLMLGIHELVRACGEEGVALTVLLGDHDGDDVPAIPPLSVLMRILQSLDGELARRSPLRSRAA